MENTVARKRKQVPEGYLIIGVDPQYLRSGRYPSWTVLGCASLLEYKETYLPILEIHWLKRAYLIKQSWECWAFVTVPLRLNMGNRGG